MNLSVLRSKTFTVIVFSILVEMIIRLPWLGYSPDHISEIHDLIVISVVTFGGKEAVTNHASKGATSGK